MARGTNQVFTSAAVRTCPTDQVGTATGYLPSERERVPIELPQGRVIEGHEAVPGGVLQGEGRLPLPRGDHVGDAADQAVPRDRAGHAGRAPPYLDAVADLAAEGLRPQVR